MPGGGVSEGSNGGSFGSKEAAELVASVREVFRSGRTRSREWREAQLRGIERLMMDEEEAIFAALAKDLKRSRVENVLCETVQVYQSARQSASSLRKWMKPERVSTNFVNVPARSEIVSEPFGAVLIFAAWNMPFLLSLDPLIGAIAAGNVAVLKPSELAPASSALLAELLPRYVDKEAVRVVQGGADVATALLESRWDKIFFTGGAAIGRRVLAAAAKHLTPVALELGGKNPAYIDSSADFNICVKRIAFGMCVNAGQSCLSPDYVLVEESVADQFTDHLRRTLTRSTARIRSRVRTWRASPRLPAGLGCTRCCQTRPRESTLWWGGRRMRTRTRDEGTPGTWARLHAVLSDPARREHIVVGGETDEATRYVGLGRLHALLAGATGDVGRLELSGVQGHASIPSAETWPCDF
ncbi:hypothetical protein CLOM_g21854 [Closterium sp. NIES-68]|nr:hypothetical protein CLOM_g21854 [Closterium sp. NIES-68]